MSCQQGPRFAGMRTAANAAGCRHQEPQQTYLRQEAAS